MKEHIAYLGKKFTIEWYFDSKNKSPALEYFNQLDEDRQNKAISLFGSWVTWEKLKILKNFATRGTEYLLLSLSRSFPKFLFHWEKNYYHQWF